MHDSVSLRNDRADARRCNVAGAGSGGVAKSGAVTELDGVAALPAEQAPALSPAGSAAMPGPALVGSAAAHALGWEYAGGEPVLETSDDEDIAWENDEEGDALEGAQWLQAFSGLTTAAHAAAAVSSS